MEGWLIQCAGCDQLVLCLGIDYCVGCYYEIESWRPLALDENYWKKYGSRPTCIESWS